MPSSSVLFLNVAPQVDYSSEKMVAKRERNDNRDDFGQILKDTKQAESRDKADRAEARTSVQSSDDVRNASDKLSTDDSGAIESAGVLYLPGQDGEYVTVNLSQDQLAQIANMDRVSLVSPEILEQFGGLNNFMEAIKSLIPGNPALSDVDIVGIAEQIDAFSQSQLGSKAVPQLIAVNLSPAELSALSAQVDEGALSSGVFTLVNQASDALENDLVSSDMVHVVFVPEQESVEEIMSQLREFIVSMNEEVSSSSEIQDGDAEISDSLVQMLQQAAQNKKDMQAFKKWMDGEEVTAEDVKTLREMLHDAIRMDTVGEDAEVMDGAFFEALTEGMGEQRPLYRFGEMVSSFVQKNGGGGVPAFFEALAAKASDVQGGLLSNMPLNALPGSVLAGDIVAGDIDGGSLFTTSMSSVTSPTVQSAHAHGVLGTQKAGQTHQATQMMAIAVEKSIGNGGNQKLSVLLNPPELGRVQLDVEMDAQNKVKVSMITEKDSAYMLLQRDSSTLTQTLQDAGIDVDASDIDLSMAGEGFGFDRPNQENEFEVYQNAGSSTGEVAGDEDIIETSVDIYREPSIGHWRYNAIV